MSAVKPRVTPPSGWTIGHLLGYREREDLDERLKLALEKLNQFFAEVGQVIRAVLQHIATLPPSVGYEPLLIERGVHPLAARAMAHLTVHGGNRVARESKRLPAVVQAIRFLAEPGRQGAAISRRAQILLAAWEETSIIETIAGVDEFEFIELLKTFTIGDELARRRITEIAADLVPHLPTARGRKVSAASAAHEFLLEEAVKITKVQRYTYSQYAEDFTDPLTRATRVEFGDGRFDPRPALRRVKKRREKAN
jgi:hypothetical protein